MVICEIGVAAGTTTTGDVIIIPATQQAMDNPNTVNNPLPGFLTGSSPVLASTKTKLLVATNGGASGSNPAIIAGSDEYLGTMTHISNGNVNLNTRLNTADYEGAASGGAVANNAVPYFWSNGNKLNDNTNGLFDVVSKATASTNWIIGGSKVDSIMKFKMAAAASWSNDRAVAAVCGPNVGSTIPSATVMSSGTTGTSHACTAPFIWTPFAADFQVTTGYDTKVERYCKFCDATFDTDRIEMFVKEYSPPATADRLLTGMSVWAADTTGVARLTIDAGKTLTKQNPVEIGSGGCGKTGQETKKETKGQLVELSMKSPVDLAAGQHIVWEHATLAFALAGALPANSVTCTCGTRTWATTLTKEGTDKRLRLTLPASGSTTTAVTCVAGDVVCKAREWTSSSTVVAEMTDATCFACDAAGSDCTKTESQAAAKGVVKHKSDVIFTFKQQGTKSTAVLAVKDVAYQPNSKSAVGRFYFKPSTTMSLYATSTIAYTFGAQTFGTGAICQVFTSDGTKPSMTPSDIVSNCAISG